MSGLSQIFHLQEISYSIPSAMWQLHHCDHHSLVVVISGNGKLICDHETIHLTEEKCVLIPPNQKINVHNETGALCFYHLTFKIIQLQEGQTGCFSMFTQFQELGCHPFSQCTNLLEIIYRQRLAMDELSLFEQHVRFQEFMLFIMNQNVPNQQQKSVRQSVEQSIKYLQKHYERDWTVEQLAELAAVPRWNYSRIFKDITGQIPLNFLNNVRLEKAKQLLVTTNDRIFEISQTVGFNNEYYFNRRFKEHVGISPGQYRRGQSNNLRIFAPFLEDFLVALGITPIAQFSHSKWGKQDYLGLQEIPDIDIENGQMDQLFHYKPTLIMLDEGIERWKACHQLDQLAPTYHLSHPGEDWRTTLFQIADLTGRTTIMKDVINQYEVKVQKAKKVLQQSVYGQSVAFLRISAIGISLYAGPECGYTGPILYRDLGLMPHESVWNIPHYTRKTHLTIDQLIHLDADHIFITFDKQHSIFEGEERVILKSPTWSNLPAAKNNCVYEVDFLTWMNYGILSHNKKIDDVLRVLG